jgi:hypothetical protein
MVKSTNRSGIVGLKNFGSSEISLMISLLSASGSSVAGRTEVKSEGGGATSIVKATGGARKPLRGFGYSNFATTIAVSPFACRPTNMPSNVSIGFKPFANPWCIQKINVPCPAGCNCLSHSACEPFLSGIAIGLVVLSSQPCEFVSIVQGCV